MSASSRFCCAPCDPSDVQPDAGCMGAAWDTAVRRAMALAMTLMTFSTLRDQRAPLASLEFDQADFHIPKLIVQMRNSF